MCERYSSVEAVRQAKMSGELYSSLRPDVPASISNFEVAAPDVTPPRPTVDATIYMKPSCPELLPHTITRSEDGTHLVMTLKQGGVEGQASACAAERT